MAMAMVTTVNDLQRLTIEIEFVECLANPAYLNFLVEQGCLRDDKFLAYLRYLDYLSDPAYSRLFVYPNGLSFLRLLQTDHFRRKLVESPAATVDYIHKQQYYHWLHLAKQ